MNKMYSLYFWLWIGLIMLHQHGWSQDHKPVPQTYTYKTVDGCAIKADVFLPNDDDSIKPVLVYIHGGALIYGSRTQIRLAHLQRYLDEGFIVVSIDYRLAPETKLHEIIKDVQDAFYWIRVTGAEKFYADPLRIGVVGHSAGGYLTLMTGICVRPKPKVLISYYGYGDIMGSWYTGPDEFYNTQPKVSYAESGIEHIGNPVSERGFADSPLSKFYLYCRQNGLWTKLVGGVDPKESPSYFMQYCPVQNSTEYYPPTLLLHGDHDTDVPYQQSVMMAEALSKAGVEHRLITIKNGEHGFDRRHEDSDVNAAFEEVILMLNMHLKK